MTLKEIATEAGVSISTVSRVINQNTSHAASQEVEDRIWEIVRRTGYTPNITARNLQKGGTTISEPKKRSHSIACLFARTPNALSDSFFTQLARNIEQEAFHKNYLLKFNFTSIDFEQPSICRLLADNNVDGVAVLGRCDNRMLKLLKSHFRYVVYSGLNELNAKYDQIICDGYQAAYEAVKHLITLGHRHIGYIGETKQENRYLGYRAALNEHQIPFRKEYAINVSLTSESGYQGTKRLLSLNTSKEITAIFCACDITAIGVIHAIKEQGLRVPEDISVISIDDIETAQYLSPMLTTIHIPVEEMGKMTAKILIDRIEGGHQLPIKLNLPFYLANRESCASPRKKK